MSIGDDKDNSNAPSREDLQISEIRYHTLFEFSHNKILVLGAESGTIQRLREVIHLADLKRYETS